MGRPAKRLLHIADRIRTNTVLCSFNEKNVAVNLIDSMLFNTCCTHGVIVLCHCTRNNNPPLSAVHAIKTEYWPIVPFVQQKLRQSTKVYKLVVCRETDTMTVVFGISEPVSSPNTNFCFYL